MWCKNVDLPPEYEDKLRNLNLVNLKKMRQVYLQNKDERLNKFYQDVEQKNKRIFQLYKNNLEVGKLILAVLYLAEGAKSKSSIMFGNSDSLVIILFINLMRKCYKIDESKFRCTVQCRADQNIPDLERFWSGVTKIPLGQFYKARVDKRTIGQVSRKKDYKGVCRIDYFSADLDRELKYIAKNILIR